MARHTFSFVSWVMSVLVPYVLVKSAKCSTRFRESGVDVIINDTVSGKYGVKVVQYHGIIILLLALDIKI